MDMSRQTDGSMPGMLTPEQMDALRKAKGAEFDHLFLTGMIQHHNGALIMVKDLFDTAGAGQDADLFNFATDADNTQRAEIKIMQNMLERRNFRGETMNRLKSVAFRLAGVAAVVLFSGVRARRRRQPAPQQPAPQPRRRPHAAKAPEDEDRIRLRRSRLRRCRRE